jgi:hypothetical protein
VGTNRQLNVRAFPHRVLEPVVLESRVVFFEPQSPRVPAQ